MDHPYVNNERVIEQSGTELTSRDIRERPNFSSSNSRETIHVRCTTHRATQLATIRAIGMRMRL